MTEGGLGRYFAVGLPGAAIPEALPTGARWDDLLALAVAQRAVPLLANGVRFGILDATESQRSLLAHRHVDAMRSCVSLERVLVQATQPLREAGIGFRVLKGPGVAHLDYPDPSWRGFGDIDLLVPSSAYDEAVNLLERSGARRRSPEIRPGFDRRFSKGVCMIRTDGFQLDVHRTLASGPFGFTVDLDELFASPEPLILGGETFLVPPRQIRFLHACFHAALGDVAPRIVAQRDVAQMVLATDLDLDRCLEVARRWRAGSVVSHALSHAWERLGLVPSPAIAKISRQVPSRFERRALTAYHGPKRSYARQMVAAVPAIPGLGAKLTYVWSMLVVDPEYARRNDGGYAHRLRRAWNARTTP
jgi:hypothetical protein